MSAQQHTPGPWAQYADDPLVIVNAEGSSLGEASAGDPFITYAEQLANARMFATAPDLRNALMQAVESSGFSLSGPTDPRVAEDDEPAWVCNARAVIAASST